MDFIEELYFGNIRPSEIDMEYNKTVDVLMTKEKELSEKLSGENLKLFHEFMSANDDANGVNCVENFKNGFKLGVKMMVDSLALG